MTMQINVEVSVAKVLKQLRDIQKNQIPFATSRAMEKTVLSARKKVYQSIDNDFHKPGKQFKKQGRPGRQGVRSGWIRADWPSKRDIQSKKRTEASVYIWGSSQDTAGAQSKGANINEIIHRNVFGDRANTVSLHAPLKIFGQKMIVEPTGAVLSGKRIDKLIKLNKQGNIPALEKNVRKAFKDKRNYLTVKLGERNKNRNLTPGLYKKIYKDYQYKQQPRTSKGKQQRPVALVKLLSFKPTRKYKPQWDFPSIVNKSYQKEFEKIFKQEFTNAVLTAKPRR